MPPDAITGVELAFTMDRKAARLGPAKVPSVAMSVLTIAARPMPSKRLARLVASVLVSVIQPRVATLPLRASIPTTIRPG